MFSFDPLAMLALGSFDPLAMLALGFSRERHVRVVAIVALHPVPAAVGGEEFANWHFVGF